MAQRHRSFLSTAANLGGLFALLGASNACSGGGEAQPKADIAKPHQLSQALAAEDGVVSIAGVDNVVNGYAVLASGATLGAKTLSVTDAADLTVSGLGVLAAGDLLVVYQAQGATMDTTDTLAYGSVAELRNAGGYEVVGVQSVSGNNITLTCALKRAYTTAGKTQVVRVPQYDALTVPNATSIVAPAWDGVRGGIVAIHATTLTLDGSIDVSARGFRGGAVDNQSGNVGNNVPLYRTNTSSQGAEKGEGISGSATEYMTLSGRYGRGAPTNGGGGGNSHNAGGGGGANTKPAAVSLSAWTGQGFMDTNAAWANAWALDPAFALNSNALTTSPGGGRGGYTYSNSQQDALVLAPGANNWAGDQRQERGGLGGHPLDTDPTARVYFGGGGGAGDGNNNGAGRGGRGGGLVIVIATTITGSGFVQANGENGQNTSGGHNDAPGGAGAGGSVLIDAATLSGISLEAKGGVGGTQLIGSNNGLPLEAEGPGGGGGGGLIALASGSLTSSVVGGAAGNTTAPTLSEFTANGATLGGPGLLVNGFAGAAFCTDGTAPETSIDQKPSDPSTLLAPSFVFSANEPGTFECRIDAAAFAVCPANFTAPTLSLGAHTLEVRAIDRAGNVDATPASYPWTILLDTDGDGLPDAVEITLGTDPNDADTDDDGVMDGAEPQPGTDSDGDGLINAKDPDSDNDGLLDGTELGTNCLGVGTVRAKCVPDADLGATKTDPLNADTDGGGATDGSEDRNLNGRLDANETNPVAGQGADDATVVDTDGDGLSDGLERTLGSDPNDADTDDDGLLDGLEPNPSVDGDNDGLNSVLDVDSDNDALFDGTETGKACNNPATNTGLGHCIADQDAGLTKTSPLNPDTDGGRMRDGSEDGNRNGVVDPQETDPTVGHAADDSSLADTDGDGLSDILETSLGSGINDADSDDDGLLDGLEPNPSENRDRDLLLNILDKDSDGDGLLDGTEAGKDCSNAATDAAANSCIADADQGATKTWVLIADTDGGSVSDGDEDDNKNGRVDANERDPNLRTDDGCQQDGNCGSQETGLVCVAHACVPGCRGMNGNSCPIGAICSSTDTTVGQCSVPVGNAGAGGMAGAAGAAGVGGSGGSPAASGGAAGAAVTGGAPGAGGSAVVAATGGSASGGTPNAATGGSQSQGVSVEGGGCGCRITPDAGGERGVLWASLMGALSLAFQRRRVSARRKALAQTAPQHNV